MTPKEKANEILKHYDIMSTIWIDDESCYKSPKKVKEAALFCVNEVIENLENLCVSHLGTYENPKIYFWNEVKQYINNLD